MSGDASEEIKRLAAEAGYAACGITGADPFDDYRVAIESRIARYPESAPVYTALLRKADPRANAPWVNSVVVCIRRYGKYSLPPELTGFIGRSYLCDRRYAGCPDHTMPQRMKEGLRALGMRVRTGGVPCRAAAERAGLGRIGRNCFLYTEHGSWVNIEAWRVDAELPADERASGPVCPSDCRACMRACPTGSLSEPFVMRPDLCVAHLTYGSPSLPEGELSSRMGGWIYGCDVCQEVCPLNAGKWEDIEPAGWIAEVKDRLTPAALARLDETTCREVVHPRFPYIAADNAERWRQNARRALEFAKSGTTRS